MKRVVGLLMLVVCARAAHADGPCQAKVEASFIDTFCLPAVSSDGGTIAYADVDSDGERGAPNLTVVFQPAAGGKPERITVLTVEESGGPGDFSGEVRSKLATRIATLNQHLAKFTSLRRLDIADLAMGEVQNQTLTDGDLTIAIDPKQFVVKRGGKSAKLALPTVGGKCRNVNKPFVPGAWVAGSTPAWVLVEIAYHGNDSCVEPSAVYKLVAVPGAGKPVSSKAQIEQLIDSEMRALERGTGSEAIKKLFAPGAGIVYSTRGDEKEGFVAPEGMEQGLSAGMGILAPPVVSDRTIVLSKDGVSGWVSMNVKVKAFAGDTGQQFLDYRASEIVQLYPAGWRIVGGMWSMPTPNKTLDNPARAMRIVLGDLPSKNGDQDLALAFQRVLNEGLYISGQDYLIEARKDLVAIGSDKGEKTVGGPKFAKAWKAGWQGKLEVVGEPLVEVAESATTGWAIANLNWHKTKAKKQWDAPVRVLFVFMRDSKDSDWELAHAHFASSDPYGE